MDHNQTEIAKILKVSEPTISRDVQYLREQTNNTMKDYLEDLPLQHQKARWTVDLLLRESFKMLEKVEESGEKIDVMKLILQATQVRLSFLSDSSALQKALEQTQSLRQQIEKLKNSQKEAPMPKYEIISITDDNGEKVRHARKIKKKSKKQDEDIIV